MLLSSRNPKVTTYHLAHNTGKYFIFVYILNLYDHLPYMNMILVIICKRPAINHNESTMYNNKTFISRPKSVILCLIACQSYSKAFVGICYAIIKAHTDVLSQIKAHISRVKSIKSQSTNQGLGYKKHGL